MFNNQVNNNPNDVDHFNSWKNLNSQIGNANNANNNLDSNFNNIQPGLHNLQSAGRSNNNNNGPAKSNFNYEVKQSTYGNFFGHQANRDGGREEGRYYVLLPDKRLMMVEYVADETGYHPTITYSSIDGLQMSQDFLFAPEAKGSPGSNTSGTRTAASTTRRTTVNPSIVSTTAGLRGVVTNAIPPSPTQVSNSNNQNGFQSSSTYTTPSTTTSQRLTSQNNILNTPPRIRLSTIRPRSATLQSFVGFASTLRPVTAAPPPTPLSSRPTTPRGGRPFSFPTTNQNVDKNLGGNVNSNNQAITAPPFNYIPPPPPANSNNNGNGATNENNGKTASTSANQVTVDLNTNNGNKYNAFSGGRDNMITNNGGKPNTGQIIFPKYNKGNKEQTEAGTGGSLNSAVAVSNLDISSAYLPPKPAGNGQIKPEKIMTGNKIIFKNGFSFFESKKLNPTPVNPPTGQNAITTSPSPTTKLNLPINRLTTAKVPFTLATASTLITQPTANRLSTGKTSGPVGKKTPRIVPRSTIPPSRTTTDHEYDKDVGPAYIPVPGLTALVVDAPLPAGQYSAPRANQSPTGSSSTKSVASSRTVPATTQLAPKAKQLSPFFEFFKIKS